MKAKLSQRLVILCMSILFCTSAMVAQVQYCYEVIKSEGDREVTLSCFTQGGQYVIQIESTDELIGLGGSFIHINETENMELRSTMELSADKKMITIPITSTTPPVPYTPLYVLMPGEEKFNWDFNIDWDSPCGTNPDDTEAPTGFTVSVGKATYNSIELKLNATDNSGTVIYAIAFNDEIQTVRGVSGEEKSYFVTGLTPETTYTFSVTAKDPSENIAENSPVEITGTTTVSNIVGCEGTSKEATYGSFDAGFNYAFYTDGSEVTVEFEMLDDKIGLVAFAYTYNPNEADVQMDNIGGNKFSKTFTGQTPGSTFTVACKFAFAGDYAMTRTFEIIVGEGCNPTGVKMLQEENLSFYPNPVVDMLHVNSEREISKVSIINLLGQTIIMQTVNDRQASIDVSSCASGNYLVTVLYSDGESFTKKLVKE